MQVVVEAVQLEWKEYLCSSLVFPYLLGSFLNTVLFGTYSLLLTYVGSEPRPVWLFFFIFL